MTKKSDKSTPGHPNKPSMNLLKSVRHSNKKRVAGETKSEKVEGKEPATDQKALMALIEKGKAQGSLTYEEINDALPNEMMSSEMIDDTLMMFDDMDIEIIEKDEGAKGKEKTLRKERFAEQGDGCHGYRFRYGSGENVPS
jgi:hypothetical protein